MPHSFTDEHQAAVQRFRAWLALYKEGLARALVRSHELDGLLGSIEEGE